MTIPTFPTYADLVDTGLDISPVPNVRRTEFETGPARQAPTHTRCMIRRNVTYRVCSAENQVKLLSFMHKELKSAAYHFFWEDPFRHKIKADPTTVRVRVVGGQYSSQPVDPALQTWETKFTIEYWSAEGY